MFTFEIHDGTFIIVNAMVMDKAMSKDMNEPSHKIMAEEMAKGEKT
jgi:hypothetical protein